MIYARFSIILIAVLFFQCSITEQESETNETEFHTPENQPDSTEETEEDTRKTEDILHVNEFLDMPFTLSVKGGERWENEKNLKTNMHDPDITDTLEVLTYKHSEVQLLNQMYLNATIQDEDILLAKQIYVGMSRDEFESSFDELEEHEDRPYISLSKKKIVMSCCSDLEQNPVWTFGFEKDTLQIILFDNYVD